MLYIYVFFHILGAYPPVADVLIPGIERTVFTESDRFVVFPMPVLKLHTVDMEAVEVFHLRLNVRVLVDRATVVVELSHEAVAREALPVGRDIDSDGTYDMLCADIPLPFHIVQVNHIAHIVGIGGCPSPGLGCECVFLNESVVVAVAHIHFLVRRQIAVSSERYCAAWRIACLVGGQLELCAFPHYVNSTCCRR